MDYKEKYEMALEGIQEILSSGEDSIKMSRLQLRLQGIFPELKESEDEKIRKELIERCRNTRCVTEEGAERIAKLIDWLEKQGNSPIKWNKNTEGNKPQVNHSVLMKTTHGIAEGEWKGEYWKQYRWAGIVRDSDVLSWMELSDLDKQNRHGHTWYQKYLQEKEKNEGMIEALRTEYEKGRADVIAEIQKPTWSEEDEKEYKYVLKFIDNILNNCDNDKDYDCSKRCYNWVKSLKEK